MRDLGMVEWSAGLVGEGDETFESVFAGGVLVIVDAGDGGHSGFLACDFVEGLDEALAAELAGLVERVGAVYVVNLVAGSGLAVELLGEVLEVVDVVVGVEVDMDVGAVHGFAGLL